MNLNNLLAGIAQSGIASGLAGGVAGGALTSALMSKKGRKAAKTALQIGGIAAVGGLAWKAYQSYRSTQTAADGTAQAPAAIGASDPLLARWQGLPPQAFEIDAADESETAPGMLLVRAMIDASKADGHIDAREKRLIFARVEEVGLSDAEKGFLFDELTKPSDVEQIVADVKDAQSALEVYAAAYLAIDRGCERGRAYLARLAQLLASPAPLVQEIHSQSVAAHTAAA